MRIRVLHLVDTLKGGGVEETIWDLCRLRDSEHIDTLVAYLIGHESADPNTPMERLRRAGIVVHNLSLFRNLDTRHLQKSAASRSEILQKLLRLAYLPASLLHLPSLLSLLVAEDIQVIHTHLHFSFVLGSIASLVTGIPVVAQSPQLWSQTQGYTPWAFSAYRVFKPTVRKFITALPTGELRRMSGVPQSRIRLISNPADRTHVGCVSDNENPVVRQFDLREAYPILLAIGRFVPEKGFRQILSAIRPLTAKHPKLRLILLGDGWLRAELLQRVRDEGWDEHVLMPGYRSDVHHFLDAAHIYVRGHLHEGINRATIQAMAWGKPIVGFQTNAPNEMLTNEESALLVPANDIPALRDAIERLIADKELGRTLGRRGQQIASRLPDIQSVVRSIEQVYREILDRKFTPAR